MSVKKKSKEERVLKRGRPLILEKRLKCKIGIKEKIFHLFQIQLQHWTGAINKNIKNLSHNYNTLSSWKRRVNSKLRRGAEGLVSQLGHFY